jgi:hypothetical protein
MQPTPLFSGKVEDGKLTLEYPGSFKAQLAKYEGREICLRLTPRRHGRTIKQNAYYWAVVIPLLAESCGYEDEELHEALKWKFLQKHDGPLPTVRSTGTLNTLEFAEYIEQCRRLAAEMGVVIPEPGENY